MSHGAFDTFHQPAQVRNFTRVIPIGK